MNASPPHTDPDDVLLGLDTEALADQIAALEHELWSLRTLRRAAMARQRREARRAREISRAEVGASGEGQR
jgi:hypothetical protein